MCPPEPTWALPRHGAHVFLAAVEAELPREAAAEVTALFDAQRAAVESIREGSDARTAITEETARLVRSGARDSELITRLRALQVVAWNHDLHMTIDLVRVLNSAERPNLPVDEAAPLLLSYRQPYRAVTWLLAVHHVGLDEAAALPTSAASPSGATVATEAGNVEVPTVLQPAVRAQLHLREAEGAGADDRLLPYHPRSLGLALTTATRELGVPTHGRLAERQSRSTDVWLRSLGIDIRPLP